MSDIFNLQGKTALITGASQGLGARFAKLLASEGVTVILAARQIHKLNQIADNIKYSGGKAIVLPLDVSKKKQIKDSIAKILSEKIYIDTLVGCQPITGRMHQIRVHAAALKGPIVGDTQYGGQVLYLSILKRRYRLKKHTEEQPLIPRLALHAHCLEFINYQQQKIAIQAPYHKDFSTLVKQLTRYIGAASPITPTRL